MSVVGFLSKLRQRDVHVWVEGDRLRCNAPEGALTDELREQLRQRKDDIVSFLHRVDDVAAQSSAIVPLQQNGAGAAVFGVPGHTGEVFCFRALAQALGDEQPFFGLQFPGLDGRSEPLARVEDLAAYFAGQIRAFWPHGPWIIAGYCSGGTVAFELAQQLLSSGQSAVFLALFGAPHPAFFLPLSLLRHRMEYRAQGWWRRGRVLASQSGRQRLDYLVWRLRRRKQPPDPLTRMRAEVEQATLTALRAYVPRPFAGRVHHFMPCEAWARRVRAQRWRSVAPHVETYCGPDGCTGDDMLHPPYAPVFAEQFRQSCAREAGLLAKGRA